jgi:DNA-binding NtrC family response regulator
MTPRILVLDDEPAILTAMETYLRHEGYVVDGAKDRREAEGLLAGHEYACLVADVRMGDAVRPEEGLDIVSAVRERHPRTRIVVLTAYGTHDVEAEARRRGADEFLHKPKLLRDVARVVAGLTCSPLSEETAGEAEA